ncbi:MAG TPA: hypothetical protein VGO80_23545 [Solirubrobacteraceae bacterium]|jgi:hypothetical protein|nr:hypothetical protein [Solirubrobacteraceae bacterium]
MRSLLAVLAALLATPAAACAAFAASAAPGSRVSLPAAGNEVPSGLALAGGRGSLVTQTTGSDDTQAVIALPAGTRTTFAHTKVLGTVNRRDGAVDMLVARGATRRSRRQLTLRRVLPSGRILDLWSHDSSATVGALARGGDRTLAIWRDGSKLVTIARPDGGVPTHARTVPLGARGVTDLALAIDGRGRISVAAMQARGGLVVAALTRRGAVLRRQAYRGATGLVSMAVTPGGRAGVLIEDTGIEGEVGECVSDGRGRHIRAVVRERLARRFGALRTIESPPFGCGSGGALLRATRDESFTAIYQGGSYDHPPLLVRQAAARRGHGFGRPFTLLADARAETAVVTTGGELVVGLLRKTVQPEVFSGSLTVLHAPDAFGEVDRGPAFAPLLALDASGRDVLAWRTADALNVLP